MALLQTGPLVTNIAGKVAGSIFQKSSAGITLRTLRTPRGTTSLRQSQQRSILSSLQTQWLNLPAETRTLWDLWAEYSANFTDTLTPTFLNGQQAYIRINFPRIRLGLAILQTPTFKPLTFGLDSFSLFLTDEGLFLDTSPPGIFNEHRILPSLSPPLPATRNAKPPRSVLILPYQINNDATANLTQSYISTYGTLPQFGDNVWLSFYYIHLQRSAISATFESMHNLIAT